MNKIGMRTWAVLISAVLVLYGLLPALPSVGSAVYADEALKQKFDFGTTTSPVMEGFVQVDETTLYTAELGYGLDQPVASRLRSGGTDLTNDFVIGSAFTFMTDLPNGEYDVTVYSGDLLAGTSTTKLNVVLEGVQAGTVQARQSVGEATFRTTVADGQLTVGLSGANGGYAYLNGLIIREVVPTPPAAPEGLAVGGIRVSPPSVSLQWNGVTDAVAYNVYRAEGDGESFALLAQATDADYTDASVSAGGRYSYRVTAVNAAGLESQPSGAVSVEVKSDAVVPAAPANLIVSGVTESGVLLRWSASEGAASYSVFRSESADGEFSLIADNLETTAYSDAVDTSVAHYYQVRASNEAGLSEGSNVAVSAPFEAPEPLPAELPLKLDFGPGAKADGYFGIPSPVAYSPEWKYGFANPAAVGSGSTGSSDPLKDGYLTPADTSFDVDLPNGDYAVTVTAGDTAAPTELAVSVEGMTTTKIALTTKPAGEFLEQTFEVALVDGQLNIAFSGSAPKINSLVIAKLPERTAGETPTVYIASDSTVQTYDPYWKPQAGWGQMIPRFFSSDVAFSNQAIGGRSSKSFLLEGRLDNILRAIRPNDYFLIQFGHNDATISVPERYASPADYKNYLRTYVEGARQRGANPILVTPVNRRDYDPATGKFNVSFPEYVQAMKELAAELNVPLVDLNALSRAYFDSIGPEGTLAVFLHVPAGVYTAFPNGAADDTHFQEYGAIQIARILAGGIKDLGIPLSEYVTDAAPPENVPAKPTGVTVGSVSNASAVLTWNAAEGADIYRVYRKLSTDSEYALAGTTTVPTLTIQGMTEGQTYDVYVTAVNDKGESEPSDVVVIHTKQAALKFDFGLAGSPVMEGYAEVNLSTVYTPERGYGIADPTGMIGRDRGAGDEPNRDLLRDWLGYFNVGWQFNVDLPNGLYAAKLYVGDYLGSARTSVLIENIDYGTVSAGKNSVTEKNIAQISVTDGQMNFTFGGATGIVNGLEITPILLAPSGLKAEDKNTDPDHPSVALSWNSVDGASAYKVYRKGEGESKFRLLGSAAAPSYTDEAADVGMTYWYQVTAFDSSAETAPTEPLEVSMVDPNVPVPAAPADLQVAAVNKNDLTIRWSASAGAKTYNIYRAVKEGGTFELIGKTRDTSYTDTTVLTTIPYYYQVAAVSAGGVSERSATLATPAVTVLYRQAEYLDRALVAVKTDEGVYVGWKMLGTDPDDIAFNLYRDGVKVNAGPITGATNLLDKEGTASSVYLLKTVAADGTEKTAAKEAAVWNRNYLAVPLKKPEGGVTPAGESYTYNANDTSIGDLDGDGTYELIVKWDPSNAHDNSQAGYTGNVYIDAYKLDGTRLWRIDLGKNIRAGAHYTQFLVYDFDGDGKSEVAFKTADGTTDGTGQIIGDAAADHRNSSGYVLEGPEYLTMFEGMTGKALATVPYDPPRGAVADWGDGYGNRVDRFLAAVAYLDGEHPSLIFSRGYYTRTVIVAYDYKDGQLTERWKFDSSDDEYGQAYEGQGDHNLSVGDVDGDGMDEITFGAMAIDDDGAPLYNTGLGHGDAGHLGDLDPTRPGLEFFNVHEHVDSPYGMDFRDAATGEVLWGVYTGVDTGRGMAADIDPNYPGEEVWASTITNEQHIPLTGLYSAQGELISTSIPSSTNFGIWWDGDLSRELLDHVWDSSIGAGVGKIDKWDYQTGTTVNLLTADGTLSNNGTKGTPNLQADLFGDWREEAVWRSADSSELRIYTTTDLTDVRLRTLMHDPIYRLGVAWQNVGYNQPPHTSFFLGTGMETPPAPRIVLAGTHDSDPGDPGTPPLATGAPGKPVLSDDNGYDTGLRDGNYTITMNMWWGNNGTQFKLYENGELIHSEKLPDRSPSAQSAKVDIAGKKNGVYVYTCELINSFGTTKCDPLTVNVTDASPGKAVLSHDNWDGDGNYHISMNLWWGTNATRYRLYENGELIDEQTLTAHTPGAQAAVTAISGRAPVTYRYQAVLANEAGETTTDTLTITVRK